MKFKKVIYLLLAVIIAFTVAACSNSDVNINGESSSIPASANSDIDSIDDTEKKHIDDPAGEGPLLYKVTDSDGNIAWLFGSIHVGKESYLPLPEYVMDAFEGSDALAVECDIVNTYYEPDANDCFYSGGSTIDKHLTEETYKLWVESISKSGQSGAIAMLKKYKAAFWYSYFSNELVSALGAKTKHGIDRYLIYYATDIGMEIQEIESIDYQLKLQLNFSDAIAQELLVDILECLNDQEQIAEYNKQLDALINAWKTGDGVYLGKEEVIDEDSSEQEKAAFEEYNKVMITDRNIRMVEFAENALKSGKEVFITVGAAHVCGEGGMVDLLRQKGYTVDLARTK